MKEQVNIWAGDFGDDYTERNQPDWRLRLAAFRAMLDDLPVASVLEVGCNRGHNLQAIRHLLGAEAALVGIEPNERARKIANDSVAGAEILPGTVGDLPFDDDRFDLVFTAGVLIHVPPAALARSLREICRVSRRFVLAIEYFDEVDTEIEYRGNKDLLWKRDFPRHFRAERRDLTLIRSGYWEQNDGFDRSHWWLFEQPE